MKINNIKIKTNAKSYDVVIGSNIINKTGKILNQKKINFDKCLVIMDKNIPSKFKKLLQRSLKNKKNIFFQFYSTEKNKNYKNVDKILNLMFKNKFNRDDCLISFGGGITGDVSAFAASIYKRGIKFINLPSTLLSQVDSSIGGKTGINNKYGKNLIGSFYQPDLVIADTNLLESLPKREIICGYAEIFKSSLLDSKKKFLFLDKNIDGILKLKSNLINQAILNSCKLKKKIVERDEKEENLRKVLNLGHTFAHAYEATLNYSKKLNHGEAVILGINNSIYLSFYKNLLSKSDYKLIKSHIDKIIHRGRIRNFFTYKDINKIIYYMKTDKKNKSNKINLVLLKKFGKINTNFELSANNLRSFLKNVI